MAIVGLDGNNAPPTIDGVDARLWMGIQARAFTYYRREPFNPTFALGLVDGLKGNAVSRAEWARRIEASFAQLEGATIEGYRVVVEGGKVSLEVMIDDSVVTIGG